MQRIFAIFLIISAIFTAVTVLFFFQKNREPSITELLLIKDYFSCGYYRDRNTSTTLCPSQIETKPPRSTQLNWENFKPLFKKTPHELTQIEITYPIQGAWFPPDFTAPMVVWKDQQSKSWLIKISVNETKKHFIFKTDGSFNRNKFDYRVPLKYETLFDPKHYRAWKFDEKTWEYVKKYSQKHSLTVTVYGLKTSYSEKSALATTHFRSQGHVNFKTAPVPVEAPIFYRDVVLATTKNVDGKNVLFSRGKFTGLKWRLRDVSKPSGPVVMQHQKGCANCHNASRDGKWLAMELDTEELLKLGDKSGFGVKPIEEHIYFGKKDVGRFSDFDPAIRTGGYYPRISPDGRYIVVAGKDSPEHLYFNLHPNKPCMFTFYLMGGELVYRDLQTNEMKTLKGADDPNFVQQDPDWSPDGKKLVFIKAPHIDARYALFAPRNIEDFAQNRDQWLKRIIEKEDFKIQYDLWTIPWNNGKGGVAKPLPGASNDGKSHSNPRYSPDGKWIVYTQTDRGMLLQPDAELYIIPAEGGTPRRLNANTNFFNSWHSWSPNGRWLVFATKGYSNYTQMMLTYIDENGIDYPPVIVPNTAASNRAVNLPEFFNIEPGAIKSITTYESEFIKDYERGRALMTEENWKEAETALLEAKEKAWRFSETFLALGYVYLKQGYRKKARKYFEDALVREERLYHAHYSLGVLNLEESLYQKAIKRFKHMLKQHPHDPNGWHNLGVAYAAKGETTKAKEAFEKALTLNANRAVTYYNLGILLKRQKKLTKAKHVLEKGLTLSKANHASDLSALIEKAL